MTESTEPPWIARFKAPTVSFPSWNRHAPDRVVVATTESGRWQLWSWDLTTGERRQVTDDGTSRLRSAAP